MRSAISFRRIGGTINRSILAIREYLQNTADTWWILSHQCIYQEMCVKSWLKYFCGRFPKCPMLPRFQSLCLSEPVDSSIKSDERVMSWLYRVPTTGLQGEWASYYCLQYKCTTWPALQCTEHKFYRCTYIAWNLLVTMQNQLCYENRGLMFSMWKQYIAMLWMTGKKQIVHIPENAFWLFPVSCSQEIRPFELTMEATTHYNLSMLQIHETGP